MLYAQIADGGCGLETFATAGNPRRAHQNSAFATWKVTRSPSALKVVIEGKHSAKRNNFGRTSARCSLRKPPRLPAEGLPVPPWMGSLVMIRVSEPRAVLHVQMPTPYACYWTLQPNGQEHSRIRQQSLTGRNVSYLDFNIMHICQKYPVNFVSVCVSKPAFQTICVVCILSIIDWDCEGAHKAHNQRGGTFERRRTRMSVYLESIIVCGQVFPFRVKAGESRWAPIWRGQETQKLPWRETATTFLCGKYGPTTLE